MLTQLTDAYKRHMGEMSYIVYMPKEKSKICVFIVFKHDLEMQIFKREYFVFYDIQIKWFTDCILTVEVALI